jgi:hypothetical protein
MTYQWLLDSQYPLASECQPLLMTAAKFEALRQQNLAAITRSKAMQATRMKT